jgi:lysozyme
MMNYSREGFHLTQQFEGCRFEAYQDQGGVWTIGFGHTLGVHEGMKCTLEQALAWLQQDLMASEAFVNRYVRVPLSQHEYDALVDFVFNLGGGSFKASTLLKLINLGKHAEAAEEFHRWDRCKGVEVAGLLRRRLAERDEFLTPDQTS